MHSLCVYSTGSIWLMIFLNVFWKTSERTGKGNMWCWIFCPKIFFSILKTFFGMHIVSQISEVLLNHERTYLRLNIWIWDESSANETQNQHFKCSMQKNVFVSFFISLIFQDEKLAFSHQKNMRIGTVRVYTYLEKFSSSQKHSFVRKSYPVLKRCTYNPT